MSRVVRHGDLYQNKDDLTRVVIVEVCEKYFKVLNPKFKDNQIRFKTKLEKEAFFKYFEEVPELIKTLE